MNSASATDALALQAIGLRKEYRGFLSARKRVALQDVDLEISPGKVFAVLGPNGSGKTTLLKIAMGLVRPSSGTLRVFGEEPVPKVRRRVGFVPDRPGLHGFLTARETLSFATDISGPSGAGKKDRIAQALSSVRLQDQGDVRLRHFSKGMLQRVALAQALLNDPDLLILDEPIGALDPWGTRLLNEIFQRMRKAGKTVVFSSHLLPYAQESCDSYAMLSAGRVVAQGDLAAGADLAELFLTKVPEGR